jgi:hypothetical protein
LIHDDGKRRIDDASILTDDYFEAVFKRRTATAEGEDCVARKAKGKSSLARASRKSVTVAVRRRKKANAGRLNGFGTFIITLGVDGLELKKPIPITILQDADAFIASFLDANISTGGDSVEDAVANLQSLIADYFDDLSVMPDDSLGPAMLRTKRALAETVCRV